MREYLPQYVLQSLSSLHRDLAADLAELVTVRGQKRCYVAPRGSAKTTWVSKAYPLYCALEGVEPLTLLLAETGEQARAYLDSIKDEIEGNPAIARDYPAAAGKGPVWQAHRIRLRNGSEIRARGSGGRILGSTARNRRPTLVVVDDGNERGDAYSPTKRQRKLDWMIKDVLPVGEPGTNFVVAGTPIHREAIVCDLRRAGWRTRSYRALARFPERLDLWVEWEKLLCNLADPRRADTARAFYEGQRAEMSRGSEVLWPDRLTLYDIMAYRAQYGEAAYRSEYTDDPGAAEGAEWPPEYFDRPGFWFDQWPEDLVLKVQSLDPSKGVGDNPGDFQAHVMGGLHTDGIVYLDADMRREPNYIERCLDVAAVFRPQIVVAESNNTMGLIMPEMMRQVEERRATNRSIEIVYEEVNHHLPKLARMRGLTGYLSRGQIRVRNTPGGRLLVEQMRDVPNGQHDDGPDAAATVVRRIEEAMA
ncbi:MAG: hypothetical protein C0467_30015 [Planctomycetaceae bacterium]|nr:hypothetical protein [Planctomycetaceae bacterium]